MWRKRERSPEPGSPVTEALKRMSLAPPATPGELRLRGDVAEVLRTSTLVRVRESVRRPLEVYIELLCKEEEGTGGGEPIPLLRVNFVVEKYYPHVAPMLTLAGIYPWIGGSDSAAAVISLARAELLAQNASSMDTRCGSSENANTSTTRPAAAAAAAAAAVGVRHHELMILPPNAPITLNILNEWSCVYSLRLILLELRSAALNAAAAAAASNNGFMTD